MDIPTLDSRLKIPGMYIITEVTTGKMYIGSTANLYGRFFTHKSLLKSGTHYSSGLQQAFNSGSVLKFTFFITSDREEAFKLEEENILLHRDSGALFNQASDVKSPKKNFVVSPETREKLRIANTGKKYPSGRITSEETKQKMRETKKSKAKSVSIDGVIYASVNDAVTALGVSYNTISNRARSETESFKDWFYS